MDYYVIQPNSELRAYARQQLKGVWGQMALAYFIMFLISFPYNLATTINSLNSLFPLSFPETNGIDLVFLICLLIISGPFQLGFAGYFLKRIRGEEITINNIFDGFKRFLHSFLLLLIMGLFVSLWTFLLIVPGIVKGFGYSMAFFIMYDDPRIKPAEALKKSQIMMKGNKMKLFTLYLSFIGWFLLGALTFGIAYFWINPYCELSVANFYENLKKMSKNTIVEEAQVL